MVNEKDLLLGYEGRDCNLYSHVLCQAYICEWIYNGAVALPSQNKHSHSKLQRRYGLYV